MDIQTQIWGLSPTPVPTATKGRINTYTLQELYKPPIEPIPFFGGRPQRLPIRALRLTEEAPAGLYLCSHAHLIGHGLKRQFESSGRPERYLYGGRKLKDEDLFKRLSGTNGLSGAADGNIITVTGILTEREQA